MQAPLEFLTVCTVALITTIDQNGSDPLFKEFVALRSGGSSGLECEQGRGKEAKAQRPPAPRRLRYRPGKFVGWSIVATIQVQGRLTERNSFKSMVVRVQDLEVVNPVLSRSAKDPDHPFVRGDFQ